MSSTTKTTNYNLSQFADADKPTWRGDYNGDMLKIDRGMQCNANAAADAHTAATNAQNAANTNATAIAQVKTTADDAKAKAEANESRITANANEFHQYKTTTDTHLSTLDTQVAGKANSSDVYTKSYSDEHFANHLVGQAAAWKTGTERDFTMTAPTDYEEVQFDAPSVLDPAWATLSGDGKDVALTPGVYQVNFELRLINVAAGGEAYKTSIRCEISDMAGSSPTVLGQVDTYFVKESNNDAVLSGAVQGAALSIIESVGSLQHIRLRLHAPHMSTAHPMTGRVNHAAISFIKLADATTTRTFARGARAADENWSSGN
jgi:hypothetical protein